MPAYYTVLINRWFYLNKDILLDCVYILLWNMDKNYGYGSWNYLRYYKWVRYSNLGWNTPETVRLIIACQCNSTLTCFKR